MQFLIVTKPASAPPPEMILPLIDAMSAWITANRASGKAKSLWSFAGTGGGGGVIDVDSHEELDEIMAGFPFGPFSTTEVYALSDLDRSLAASRAVFEGMMKAMAPR